MIVDGKCTDCGHNCHNCDSTHCIECDFGYWLDPTGTVCMQWCPTGSVYDTTTESGSCIRPSGYWGLIDLTFSEPTPAPNAELSPWIQRHYHSMGDATENGNSIMWDIHVYGGANHQAIEFDDPKPIEGRGYWFNGECQFLTVTGFVPSLAPSFSFWLKVHREEGTLVSWIRDEEDHYEGQQFNRLQGVSKNGTFGWKWSSHGSRGHHTTVADSTQWEWQNIGFSFDTFQGRTDYTFSRNAFEVERVQFDSFLGSWCDVHFIVGAFHGHLGETYSDYFKGFICDFQAGLYTAADYDSVHVIPDSLFCTCDSDDCPLDIYCLGVCNWNYFWNGNHCERCPYWCADGCQENGLC